jgi:hypothetical protein
MDELNTRAGSISGVEGWSYRPFEPAADDEGGLRVTAERDDGVTVSFTVPEYVSRGDEIHDVARVVIAARERMERGKGLGA